MSAAFTDDDFGFDLIEEPDYDTEPIDLPDDEAAAFDLANWHLREIATRQRRRHDVVANFDAEIKRLEIRRDDRLGVIDREIAWHERPLKNLHRAILERDDKRKTITLACGTLKARAQQPEWLYRADLDPDPDQTPEDFDAFAAWAFEHHPELLAAPVVTVKVLNPVEDLTAVMAALAPLIDDEMVDVSVPDLVPAKAEVKKKLVKKDDKGKKVLAYGVDPETDEKPPGLIVREKDPEYSVDTDDDQPPAEVVLDDAVA